MRPVLAMLVAEAVGKRGKAAIPFGCALEIIHNFTLVHDDVMDKDEMRRGRPAVHVLFDEPTAIIAGDALFARAYEILCETDVPGEDLRRLVRTVSDTVYLIAEGQQMDMDFEVQADRGGGGVRADGGEEDRGALRLRGGGRCHHRRTARPSRYGT